MKTGIYPGSFNPWHQGHGDVLLKALKIFDTVIVVKAENPEKEKHEDLEASLVYLKGVLYGFCSEHDIDPNRLWITQETRTLVEMTKRTYGPFGKPQAIIRGLRNGHDLQYEMNQQYWNEDVGVEIPFIYFITDRKLSHVSSSSIRMVNQLGLKHDY